MKICLLQRYVYTTNTLSAEVGYMLGKVTKIYPKKWLSPPFTLYGGLSQTLPKSHGHSQHTA